MSTHVRSSIYQFDIFLGISVGKFLADNCRVVELCGDQIGKLIYNIKYK